MHTKGQRVTKVCLDNFTCYAISYSVVSIKGTGSLNYFEDFATPVRIFSCDNFFLLPLYVLLFHAINDPPVHLLPPVCLIDTTEYCEILNTPCIVHTYDYVHIG